jgi:hypothetical protein
MTSRTGTATPSTSRLGLANGSEPFHEHVVVAAAAEIKMTQTWQGDTRTVSGTARYCWDLELPPQTRYGPDELLSEQPTMFLDYEIICEWPPGYKAGQGTDGMTMVRVLEPPRVVSVD